MRAASHKCQSSEVAHLLLPDGSTASVNTVKSDGGLDKTITPNTPVNYGGLNWTLQSVTLSLSGDKGTQAAAGMRYVILSLRVDNPTSHDVVIGFPKDYMRLKSTDATSAPIVDTMTLPGHAPANTTNVTGMVFFLMPENDTSFTLEWLVSKNPVYDPVSDTQVNTPFQ